MTTFESITCIVSIMSLSTLIVGLSYTAYQVRLSRNANNYMHEWNKRKVTYELLKDFSGGEFAKILDEVKALSKTNLDSNSNYKTIVLSMTEDEKHKFDKKIDQLLNYFEGIAISIKNDIVDEYICYDYASIIYKRYYNIFKEYIVECRNVDNEQSVYIDFENISLKWIAEMERENRKNIDDRIKPGKPLSDEKEKAKFKKV